MVQEEDDAVAMVPGASTEKLRSKMMELIASVCRVEGHATLEARYRVWAVTAPGMCSFWWTHRLLDHLNKSTRRTSAPAVTRSVSVTAFLLPQCLSVTLKPDGWRFVVFWCDRLRDAVFMMRKGVRIPETSSSRLLSKLSRFHWFAKSLTSMCIFPSMCPQMMCAHGMPWTLA